VEVLVFVAWVGYIKGPPEGPVSSIQFLFLCVCNNWAHCRNCAVLLSSDSTW